MIIWIIKRIWIVMLTGFLIGGLAFAASAGTVTVPAGTHLLVQMTQSINSRQHSVGHQFTAVLEGDTVVNGTVVAPHGTRVYGRLIQARQAGRVAGRSEMTIELTQMLINNQRKSIKTSNVQAVASSGSGRSTAGRTVRGAAVGGIIGGRDGARTGAKIGAGVSVLTRGQSISIPAGTLLDFTLATPFTL